MCAKSVVCFSPRILVIINILICVTDHLNTFLQYRVADGHLNASCFATGLPRPNISWVPSGGEKNEREITNPNGTVSLISSILVDVSSLKQPLICRVTHRGEQRDLQWPEAERGKCQSWRSGAWIFVFFISSLVTSHNNGYRSPIVPSTSFCFALS